MKKGSLAILLAISIFTFVGCAAPKEPILEEKMPKPAIKIGATLALSGPFAFIGQAEQYGIELAVKEINEGGGVAGRMIEVVYEDNAGDAKNAVSGVQKLIHKDNVDVFYSAFTHITRAVNAQIGETGKTLIYASSIPDMAIEFPNHFRDFADAKDDGIMVATYMKDNGVDEAVYLGEISDVCGDFFDGVKERAEDIGLILKKVETYSAADPDFRTPLLKLLGEQNTSALITCTWKHNDIFMKQLKELAFINTPTYQFGGPFLPHADTEELRNLYEENETVSTWPGGVLEEGNDAATQLFIDAFVERYGTHPRPDAVFTYDDIHVLADALEQCASPATVDHDCVRSALLTVDYAGIGGRLQFDEQGVSRRPTTLIRVSAGKWKRVE